MRQLRIGSRDSFGKGIPGAGFTIGQLAAR
jgi:hypothetical protein